MSNQSFSVLTREQQQGLICNTVEAWQVLYRSVSERRERELVSEKIKRGIFNKNLNKVIKMFDKVS